MKWSREQSVSIHISKEGTIHKRQIFSPYCLVAVSSVAVVVVTLFFMVTLPVNVLPSYSAIIVSVKDKIYNAARGNKSRVGNVDGDGNVIEKEFQKQMFRVFQARIDWEGLLIPCGYVNSAKNKTLIGYGKINETSRKTSVVEYIDIRPAGQFSRIFIHTRTKDGQNKTIGGDFWMVSSFKSVSICLACIQQSTQILVL
jgi:hypothetical protein